MAKHSIVRLDKVKATRTGHLYSVEHTEDMDNGSVVVLGDLKTGETEIKEVIVPEGTDEPLALIYQAELMYDETKISSRALENFYNPANVATRAYQLDTDDIYSVTTDGIDAIVSGEPVVGNFLVAQAGSLKLKEVATVTGTEVFVGKVIDREKIGTGANVGQAGVISRVMDLVVIEVKRNHK